jgi:hypothetical protein
VVGAYGSGADLVAKSLEILGLPRGDADEVRQLHEGILRQFDGTPQRPRLPWRWEGSDTGHAAVSALRFPLKKLVDGNKSVISDPTLPLFARIWRSALEDIEVRFKTIIVTRNTGELIDELKHVFPSTSYGERRWLVSEIEDGICSWTMVNQGDFVTIDHNDLHKKETLKQAGQVLGLEWPEKLDEKWEEIELLHTEGVH